MKRNTRTFTTSLKNDVIAELQKRKEASGVPVSKQIEMALKKGWNNGK